MSRLTKVNSSMFPRFDIECAASVPRDAKFWTPKPSEIDPDEGFGNFRDVWPLRRIGKRVAQSVLRADQQLAALACELAADRESFETLAHAIETNDLDSVERPGHSRRIRQVLNEDDDPLGSLDVGVAGLVYALAAAGTAPAASCRGHATKHAWSLHPVVLIAAKQEFAEALVPMLHRNQCGFAVSGGRPEFLAIVTTEIPNSLKLAADILDHVEDLRQAVPKRRYSRKPRTTPAVSEIQSTLW